MKKNILCVPKVFVANIANDMIEDMKKNSHDSRNLSFKDWIQIILIPILVVGVLGALTVLWNWFLYIPIGFTLLIILLGLAGFVLYIIENWRKAKDQCFDILMDK